MDIVLKASKNDANFALWNPYYGIGTPFFQFLSLFSYYVILPFSLFGLKPYQIIKAGVILFFILAAISMYFSVKLLSKKRLQAIFASSFYIFSGYILLSANYRNAIEELFGLILVPIILSTYIKALSNAESNYAIISGMFLSLLVLTHIPTTYTVFVAVSICTIFILMKDRHKKSIFKTISIYIMFILVGIGLSSWWILPILNNINSLSYASSSEFLRNYVSHLSPIWRLMVREQWFVLQTSPWMPLYIGNVTIVLATLSFLDKRTKINDFFIVLFTISLIFSFSVYLTQYLPLITITQFPWRFLSIFSFSNSYLAGVKSSSLYEETKKIEGTLYKGDIFRYSHFFSIMIFLFLVIDMWPYTGAAGWHYNYEQDIDSYHDAVEWTFKGNDTFRIIDALEKNRRAKYDYWAARGETIYFANERWTVHMPKDSFTLDEYLSALPYENLDLAGYLAIKYAIIQSKDWKRCQKYNWQLSGKFGDVNVIENPYFRPFVEITANPNEIQDINYSNATLTDFRTNKFVVDIKNPIENAYLVVKMAWYGDWKAFTSTNTRLEVKKNYLGLIYVPLKAGQYEITFKITYEPPEILISVGVMFLIVLYHTSKKSHERILNSIKRRILRKK